MNMSAELRNPRARSFRIRTASHTRPPSRTWVFASLLRSEGHYLTPGGTGRPLQMKTPRNGLLGRRPVAATGLHGPGRQDTWPPENGHVSPYTFEIPPRTSRFIKYFKSALGSYISNYVNRLSRTSRTACTVSEHL